LWDRTIQNVSDTLPDFGAISEHPERLDINLGVEGGFPGAIGGIDWLHCNSVEYIEEYDWIMISSKHMHEIYIIDHSTTTDIPEATMAKAATFYIDGAIQKITDEVHQRTKN